MEFVTLSNGVEMPILGYGVYQVTKEECERCVLDALEIGYRHIDTAQSYFNEEEVGAAIKKSGVPREEIFLTTKVWIEHYGYEQTKASVEESMRKLGTDYLDLVLLHQPFADAYGAWRALEEFYEAGRIRALGISNFYADRMVDFASFNRIRPMVNQMETHIFNQQKSLKEWADKYDIRLEAWSPFGEGRGGTFDNPVVAAIAAKYGKTAAQVMLRWNIQRGVIVIPKSTHKERMEENFAVFDFALTDDDMDAIASLDQQKSAFFSHQDPRDGRMVRSHGRRTQKAPPLCKREKALVSAESIIFKGHRMDGASVFCRKNFIFFASHRRNFPIILYMKTALVLL